MLAESAHEVISSMLHPIETAYARTDNEYRDVPRSRGEWKRREADLQHFWNVRERRNCVKRSNLMHDHIRQGYLRKHIREFSRRQQSGTDLPLGSKRQRNFAQKLDEIVKKVSCNYHSCQRG